MSEYNWMALFTSVRSLLKVDDDVATQIYEATDCVFAYPLGSRELPSADNGGATCGANGGKTKSGAPCKRKLGGDRRRCPNHPWQFVEVPAGAPVDAARVTVMGGDPHVVDDVLWVDVPSRNSYYCHVLTEPLEPSAVTAS